MKLATVAAKIPCHCLADPEFAALDIETRSRAELVLESMRQAVRSSGNIGEAVKAFGAALGWPEKTARRWWDKIVRHGWRGALDERSVRKTDSDIGRRPLFIAFFRSLCELHNRSCAAAWNDLVMLYRAGNPIDGYPECNGRPPATARTGLPAGWTYSNLMRFAPDEQNLLLSRVGRKALQGQTTALWTTRVGMRCGQVYQFDDVWHDHKVFFGTQLVRPLELGCIDLFSTRRVLFGLAPRVQEDDESMRGLRESHMLYLVMSLLTDIGFDPEGCTLIVEHGTAAIREDIERRLFDASRKRIRVERSGIQNKPAVLGWWAGEGGGNPRMKGCLESLHGYYHNRLGLLPAQTGGNSRTDKPENLAAIEKYSAKLARELDGFRPDQVKKLLGLLRLPALTLHQFHMLAHEFYTAIDSRTQHALEGWDRAGLVRAQWRLDERSEEWYDADRLSDLDERQMAAVQALLDSNPALMRPQRLSPLRVWTEQQSRLTRTPAHVWPQILGPDRAREVTLRDRRLEFADQNIDPDGLRFSNVAMDSWGQQVLLREGEKYLCYVSPYNPRQLMVCDGKLRYVGTCVRIERAPRVDRNAILAAIGKEAQRNTDAMADYRARHAGEADAHQEMLRHNDLVLDVAAAMRDSQPVTADDAYQLQDDEEIAEAALAANWKQ